MMLEHSPKAIPHYPLWRELGKECSAKLNHHQKQDGAEIE
jgi:hypothetical protein